MPSDLDGALEDGEACFSPAGRAEIHYQQDLAGIGPELLQGFFVGWPQPPSGETLLAVLTGASHRWLARAGSDGPVIGFISAISDGVLSAYIPLLEVLPQWQGHGIGRALVRRMLASLEHLYMVDLCCDPELRPFYEREGFHPAAGMLWRNYDVLEEVGKPGHLLKSQLPPPPSARPE